ncbi:MAG TPA: gephyrin-like molybdotransferase Glp [Gaiellaceae bacterium]|nr:gephyrin-like molybdotransferase Glp [Gaiellaceae bacterium]
MESLLTFEQAQERVLARVRPLGAEDVPVGAAAGRFASADVAALVDLPPFASSAMDGYALRSADLPGTLRVVGESAAGAPFAGRLEPGEAVAISTGAVVPEGADAVAQIEIVGKMDNGIEVPALEGGANVRPPGGDIHAGTTVVPAGIRLGPAHVAAAAAAGVASVQCARLPRVAVIATGSELVPAGRPLAPGQVYEANGAMLVVSLAAAPAEVAPPETVGDDEAALRSILGRALSQADVLVTSGGVSVGEHDLVRAIEGELGVVEDFWRVALKPGKPLAFGLRGDVLVFGLPGNPVSALVGAELFVKPALRALQGAAQPLPPLEPGRLAAGLRRDPERDQFVRARTRREGDAVLLEPVRGQESHMIARSAAADALVHVPRGNGLLEAGSAVSYLRL